MRRLLHRVRRRRAAQPGDAGAGRDAPLSDGTMSSRVRDVRMLLRTGGQGAAPGPAGQVGSGSDDSVSAVWLKRRHVLKYFNPPPIIYLFIYSKIKSVTFPVPGKTENSVHKYVVDVYYMK